MSTGAPAAGEKGQRLGLGVVRVEGDGLALAPAARAAVPGEDDAEGGALCGAARRIGQVAAADLEQANARRAAPRVALGGGEKAGEERRAHDLQLLADRVGEAPGAAAERGGLALGDEAPGDRLVQPTRGGGAAEAAFELLLGRGGGAGNAGHAGEGHGRDLVQPLDPDHFLDQVGGTVHVPPPGRHPDGPGRGDGGEQRVRIGIGMVDRADGEPERQENARLLLGRDVEAAKTGGEMRVEGDDAGRERGLAGAGDGLAVPPQMSRTSCVAIARPSSRKAGSTPPFEALGARHW